MHERRVLTGKNRAPMIRTHSSKQLTIAEFDWPFEIALDKNRRRRIRESEVHAIRWFVT